MSNTHLLTRYDLLEEGGEWLGAARNYLKSHIRGGDTCIWSSADFLSMAVFQIEELAASAVLADRKETESLKDRIETLQRKLLKTQCELSSKEDQILHLKGQSKV